MAAQEGQQRVVDVVLDAVHPRLGVGVEDALVHLCRAYIRLLHGGAALAVDQYRNGLISPIGIFLEALEGESIAAFEQIDLILVVKYRPGVGAEVFGHGGFLVELGLVAAGGAHYQPGHAILLIAPAPIGEGILLAYHCLAGHLQQPQIVGPPYLYEVLAHRRLAVGYAVLVVYVEHHLARLGAHMLARHQEHVLKFPLLAALRVELYEAMPVKLGIYCQLQVLIKPGARQQVGQLLHFLPVALHGVAAHLHSKAGGAHLGQQVIIFHGAVV